MFVEVMNLYDVGWGCGGVEEVLYSVIVMIFVFGIDSDCFFFVDGQQCIVCSILNVIDGDVVVVMSDFGYDGFFIEIEVVGMNLCCLFDS